MWFHVMSQQTLNWVLMDTNPPLWETWFLCNFVSKLHWSVAYICYRLRYLRTAHHGRSPLQIMLKGEAFPVHTMNAYGGSGVVTPLILNLGPQMGVSSRLHASAALPRDLLHRRLSSPLHFLPSDTFLKFNSLRRFAVFTSWRLISCFPVLSLVLRLKCLDLFLHSTIRLHGVHSDAVPVLHYTNSLVLFAVNGRLLPLSTSGIENCSCMLMDTAAISWRFATWHFKAYFSSVHCDGNHTGCLIK
jgi:hypothetical protein